MELRHLRYFLAVAEAGHMTRAAAALGIQQPPLSQQIKALEQACGVSLFVRHPKGVTLTDAGRQFQAEAQRIVGDIVALQRRMAALGAGLQGRLALAFTSSAAAHAFTPEALRACRSRYPAIALDIGEDHAAGITDALAAGRLHCGFLRVPVARPAGVKLQTLLTEPAVLALPLGHPLARLRRGRPQPVALRELHGERLILVRRPGAPGLYANLLNLCEQHGVQPVVVAEVERMMTNLNLVAAGVGASVVPASMTGAQSHAIVYCPFAAGTKLDAPLTLAWRDTDPYPPAATFVALVREIAAARRAVPARAVH